MNQCTNERIVFTHHVSRSQHFDGDKSLIFCYNMVLSTCSQSALKNKTQVWLYPKNESWGFSPKGTCR